MPQEPVWPESHTEQTDIFPVFSELTPTHDDTSLPKDSLSEAITREFPTVSEPQLEIPHENSAVRNLPEITISTEPDPGQTVEESSTESHNPLRRGGLISGAIFAALIVLYGIDLLANQGNVPRGVTVAGVEVGGLSKTAAETQLRDQLKSRLSAPVPVKAGDIQDSLDPEAMGLTVNWKSTLDRIGRQPLNPITRITSFFTTQETGVVSAARPDKLTAAMEELRAKVDRAPVEGDITFQGTRPTAVMPQQGQRLEPQGATQVILADWAMGKTLALPVAVDTVKTNPETVRKALEEIAQPAVSAPVTIHGEGKDAKLDTKTIASVLTFHPDDSGELRPQIDQEKTAKLMGSQLANTEKEGKDARIIFAGNEPAVESSVEGRTIDWTPTLLPLLDVLKKPQARELNARYTTKSPELTTDQAKELGVKEVIGEFSTGGFAGDSGTNIKVVAHKVDGAVIKPGETFSLNDFTGPRGVAQGYVEAGVIENGAPAREVGGGISQFATTLYNASYFAGLKDAGHKEHSYYISRYPAAREATVFQGADGTSLIDLKFTNDSSTGVVIQTIWTPSQITVKLWGTKRYKVESVPGGRANLTEPQPKPGPADNCHASNGAQGFTTSDTRILRDVDSGQEVRRGTRTVKYNPQPKITCGEPVS